MADKTQPNYFDQFDSAPSGSGTPAPGGGGAGGNYFDQFDNQPAKAKSGGNRLTDIGVTALKGAIAVPEAAVGIADMVTGGEAGKLVENAGVRFKDAKDHLNTLYSPAQQKANQAVADAKGFFPTVGAMLENPSTIAHAALESAPSMLGGMGVARGVMKAAPSVGPIVAGAIGEGATAAGQNAEQVRQESADGLLTNKQSAIMAASGALTGVIGLGAGQLANRLGVGEASTMLAAGRLGAVGEDAIAAGAQKGLLRKIGEGALVEGVGQELPQSFQEQVAQNLAQEKPWHQGAAEAAAQGMLAGGLMGAVTGPLASHAAPAADQHQPGIAPPAQAPAVPPSTLGGPVAGGPDTAPAPPAADAGPLTRAASLAPGAPQQLWPFTDMANARKQADAQMLATGIPYEAGDHPSVPGRFAAQPVTLAHKDHPFIEQALEFGLDPSMAEIVATGQDGAALFADVRAYNPEVSAQQWRDDPAARARLAASFLKQETDELGMLLGREPDPIESYIARQVGVKTAASMLTMDPAQYAMRVSDVMPDIERAQRAGIEGMHVGEALQTLAGRAQAKLAKLTEVGDGNLGTAVSAANQPAAGGHGDAAVGNTGRTEPVAGGPAATGNRGPDRQPGEPGAHDPQRAGAGAVDDLYTQAVRHVQQTGSGSVAKLQMALKIGYNRAARMLERMEQDGLVSKMESNGNRTVLAQQDDPDAIMARLQAAGQQEQASGGMSRDELSALADEAAGEVEAEQQAAAGVPGATAGGAQPVPVGAKKRAPAGAFRDEVTDAYANQVNHTLTVRDADGKVQGTLEYVEYNEEPSISMIDVPEGARRQGYATQLVQELQRQYPGKEIGWGMQTGEGAALRKSLPQYQAPTEHAPAFDRLAAATKERDDRMAQIDALRAQGALSDAERVKADQLAAPLNDLHDEIADLEHQLLNKRPAKTLIGQPTQAHAIDAAAHAAATSTQNDLAQPTEAQKAAGNYKKGHVNLQGLDISIENPIGSTRTGKDPGGKPWKTTMISHYGYIKGTQGADKDHIDTYIGPNPDSQNVFIVDQFHKNGKGKFDEHKVMLGYDSIVDAQAAYKAHYDADWRGGKHMSSLSMDEFKAWLKTGKTQEQYEGSEFGNANRERQRAEQRRLLDDRQPGVQHLKWNIARFAQENERDLALAKKWGFTDATVPVNTYHGTVDGVFHDNEKAFTFDNRKGGQKRLRVDVTVAQAPNGKWAMGTDAEEGHSGRSAAPSIHGEQYDSRDAAIRAGVAKVRAWVTQEASRKALDDQLVKVLGKPAGAAPAGAKVDYPNRQLGFQYAATDEQDAYNDHAWANITAANMRVGDTFALNGKQQTVESITGKTLKLKDADGKVRTYNPDGVSWEQFTRDLGGQLVVENLQANNILKPARPLLDILKRDPAAHVDAKGSVYLKDGGVVAVPDSKASTQDGPAHSAQFQRYAKWIQEGKAVPPGMVEQIKAEERLEDGEIDQLLAMLDAREQTSAKQAGDSKAPLANATAPEHVQLGVDDRELTEIVAEFNAAQAGLMRDDSVDGEDDDGGGQEVTNIFLPPKKGEVVRLNDKAKVYHKTHGWMTPQEAKAKIAEWKAHAKAQGENDATRSANAQKVVLSLFDLSGKWSEPWEEAGYQVYRFDIQDDSTYTDPETGEEKKIGDVHNMSVQFFNDIFGSFDGLDVHAILAACPCTDFAVSGARHFAAKDADGRTVASVKLVHQTLAAIEYFKPSVWALENPVGRIEQLGGLPPWRLSFDPNHLGDPYTKKTLIWGRFNADLPIAPVEPTEGSKMHRLYGGKSQATKNARSETPEGFAYAFFMANNAVDHPAMAIANKYDRLDGKLIEQAVKAGVTEERIDNAVEDFYYQDLDDDAANDALRELIAQANPDTAQADAVQAQEAVPQRPAGADGPLKFYSGMSRPGDFTKLFAEHRNVGITIKELSAPSIPRIAQAMAKSNGHLFVDSGAFPIYQRNERAFREALEKGWEDWKGEEVLPFDQIMARYEKLRDAINEADDGGFAGERAYFVMPDVIGRQDESLRLVGEFAGAIKGFGEHAIVPLQSGELSLTKAFESMMLELGLDPDLHDGPRIGIPSNALAVSNEELTDLLKKHGDTIPGVHILGAVSDARLAPRLEAIRAAGYEGKVSADANRLRALMYGERPRDAAWEALLAESKPEQGPNAPAQGKELLRHAGKYGKGMKEANANMWAANQAKANPQNTYTVEEAEAEFGPSMFVVVVREKATAPAAPKKTAAQELAERDQARAQKDRADFAKQEKLWTGSAFAPRIQALLDKLVAAGQEGYAKTINGGFNTDAKTNQLDEAKTAFREENVRKFLLDKGKEGQPVEAVAVETMTADKLAELTNVARALPKAIVDAAVARWNALAPALGKQGFRDYRDVHSNHAHAAREAAQQLRDILNALDGLAARRYQEAKEHKNLNPEAVKRNEQFASDTLGIDTTAHPGVDTRRQITLGAGVKGKQPDAKPAVRREGDDQLLDQVKAWGYTDDNMPKGGAGGGVPLAIPGAVEAYAFDNQRSGRDNISYVINAVQGPNGKWGAAIRYRMGGGAVDVVQGGRSHVAWDAPQHDSRVAAAQAAFDTMKQAAPEALWTKLHNSFKAYLAGEKYQAKRAELPDAKLRFAKGFASPEQEIARIPLLYAVWNAQESIAHDRDKVMAKAVAALAKLPQGRLTMAGAVKLMKDSAVPGKFVANDYSRSLLAPGYIASFIEGRTAADVDAAYQEYVDFAPAPPALTKDYFLHALKERDQAAKATQPAKAPASQAAAQDKAQRAIGREVYAMFTHLPGNMAGATAKGLDTFTQGAQGIINDWLDAQYTLAGNDQDRKAALNLLRVGDKLTLPKDFYASLFKYAQRSARADAKLAARDPAAYKQALLDATIAAQLPVEAEQVKPFVTGWDHALAGKTKSTLPAGELYAKGYDAGQAWTRTDAGRAWYDGKRGKKLENTGADLRRWYELAKAKMDSLSADNLPDAYEVLKAEASRANAFANLAGDNATPGTKRYLTELRNALLPFQEWLLEHPLRNVGGVYYTKSAPESQHIAAFLDGKTYVADWMAKNMGWDAFYPGEGATAEQRLALLRHLAGRYLDMLRALAGAMEGVTTVAGASERFMDFMVKDPATDAYHRHHMTELGKQVDLELIRGNRGGRFDTKGYYTQRYQRDESKPDDPTTKKQPLVTPRLDRVERNGLKDHRKGKDITAQKMKATFGFADVGFGEWVASKEGQEHLNYAYDAFMDLADFLGIPPTGIGLGGQLHFTIGALGHGKHAAHYQALHPLKEGGTVRVINLTKTQGDGTVAHEWFHALDHALSDGRVIESKTSGQAIETWNQHPAIKRVLALLSKRYNLEQAQRAVVSGLTLHGSQIVQRGRSRRNMEKATDAEFVANAEEVLDWYKDRSNPTAYKNAADALGADYWGNPRELIARAAEAYVHDRMGGINNYLVNPEWVGEGKVTSPAYKGTPYPQGEERKLFADAFAALAKALRFGKEGVTVDMPTFEQEMPSGGREEYNAALEAMRDSLPELLKDVRTQLRVQKEAAERKKQTDAKAQADAAAKAAETARLAEEERLRQSLAEQAPSEPQGPLNRDELADLVDAAANELTEAAQESDAPAMGEPAAATGRWTQEDYRHLIEQIDAGKVILLADNSLGLATIHDVPNAQHLGYGVLRASNGDFDVTFDGGGAMARTPSGQAYTTVQIARGRDAFLKAMRFEQAKTKLQAKLLVKSGPKAAPTLNAEQQKSVSSMAAEAAKLGVQGLGSALEGLYKIFGGGSGRIMSFPSGFDKEAYEAAKPHFEDALRRFQAAGQTLKELFKFLLQQFGLGVKPYLVEFAHEKGLSMQLSAPVSATRQVADWVQQRLANNEPITAPLLFKQADQAFAGTQAEGKYSVKDAYDAMEAGVNRHILAQRITPDGSAADALRKIHDLQALLTRLPTQTRRTGEQDEFQQFSTPPQLAFAAAWAANITANDVMLEPSAGIGGLAAFGQLAGAQLVVNELSSRRAAILREVLPEARHFGENAEQLHNILPADVQPTVIVMNPPFSATAGRVQGSRDTSVGAQHIEQALKRLQPGGRLVAIVGEGMADDRPAFKEWWGRIKQAYTVRANIGMDGGNYAKYGTTFDNQLLVIDKTGKTTAAVVTGKVKDIDALPALLEGIRNDRQEPHEPGRAGQPATAEPGRGNVPAPGLGNQHGSGGAGPDALGAGQRGAADTAGGVPPGQRQPGGQDQPHERLGAAPGDGVPDQPGATGGRGSADGRPAGGQRQSQGSGGTAAGQPGKRHAGNSAVAGVKVEAQEAARNTDALTDAIFENYAPQRLAIPGAKAHPGMLVQSAAMAAVEPPIPTYTPNLPKSIIDKGLLSLAQLEAVVYAGQAHAQLMPDGQRRGFFIGDGTGVGKGREIAGIVLDNLRQGRKKALWISEKQGLLRDAKRDMTGIGGDASQLFSLSKTKATGQIAEKEGILFTTYDTLRGGEKQNANEKKQDVKTRVKQIVAWLGKDFDGVVVFDEAHNMANAEGKKGKRGKTKPSAKALAGIELQAQLPKARIVYVSATGATEVSNLVYAQRLGLWGEGTAFAKASDFYGNIDAGGVAAMELVSRDMKAMGSYIARSLSFDGVTYERLEHPLDALQTDIYNKLAEAWQLVLQNINSALEETQQSKNGAAKSAALSRFWGSHQRFFNQIITSMQMPTIIEDAQRNLADGKAVVFQLVNTNEAEQERQAARIANDSEASFEDLDFTPRQTLIEYVQSGFPVQQYELVDDGEKKSYRPVMDSQGRPVFNQDMIAVRDQLVADLQNIRVPDNPIDMLIDALGADKVAEVTGRSRRFVRERDDRGELVTVEQKRPGTAAVTDAQEFMDDKRQALIFSDAGGTGYSFHADKTAANQRQRVHYLVQPGWRANKAVQGFGRTHRTNEANQPVYVLPTTNLAAQKRFISSIARRLDQLGALTKGQRQTGSQGMFSAADNLESSYASDALSGFFISMYHGHSPLNFHDVTNMMGLNGLVNEETGALNEDKLPEIPQFLNRLLSLTTDMQDTVFNQFFRHLESVIENAKANGTYDAGVETVVADKVEKVRDEVAHTDARTGAQTRYVELALSHPTVFNAFDDVRTSYPPKDGREFIGFFRAARSGNVFALTRTGGGVNAKGQAYVKGTRIEPSGYMRYVDNIDTIMEAAEGKGLTVKKMVPAKVYQVPASGDLTEQFTVKGFGTQDRTYTVSGNMLAGPIQHQGYQAVVASVKADVDSARNQAQLRLLARIEAHLVDGEVEQTVPAYIKLTPEQAKDAWAAQQAATSDAYQEPMHLLTGVLLPVWDRITGHGMVVRTQTDDGERLLGRVVSKRALKDTLRNLGVNSSVGNLTPAQLLERLMAGDKALLANGWQLKKVKVSNDDRVEIIGADLAYSQSARKILQDMGTFQERIQWQERIFVPTGPAGVPVLERLLAAKPLVELIDKDGGTAAGDDALSVEQPKAPYDGGAPDEPGYTDPYEHTETRPGTTAAQLEAGRSAVAALARRIGAAGLAGRVHPDDRTPGRVLGQALLDNFVAGRPNQLVGQTVITPADLATLAQVYRDPRFETFRVVFVKDGLVVGESGYTSRMPASVQLPPSFFAKLAGDMRAFGAEGYYVMHNHPSGSAKPSDPDIFLTRNIAGKVPGMLAHVIIDHNEYGVITPDGAAHTVKDWTLNGVDYRGNPPVPHALLGKEIHRYLDVANLAKALQVPDGHATLVLTTGNKVTLMVDVPMAALMDTSPKGITKGRAMMRALSRAGGANSLRFIVLPDGADAMALKRWATAQVVTDIVTAGGLALSNQGIGGAQEYADNKMAWRAYEPKTTYGSPLEGKPADVARKAGHAIKAVTWNKALNKGVDYRGIGLQFLGRRQLVQRYGSLFPQDGGRPNSMAAYENLAMQMDAEINEAKAQADEIAVRWGKAEDHKALAELMHKATLYQVDPRKPMHSAMVPREYNVVRKAYEALSPAAKKIFSDASAAYEKHYAAVKMAIRNRIINALPDHPGRASLLAKMDAELFHDWKGIYFPLARFGDYMIRVRGPEGTLESFSMAETMSEAKATHETMLQAYGGKEGYEVMPIIKRKEFNAARDAVGRGFLQQLYGVIENTGKDEATAELLDAINQLYLTSLPDLSWAKHGIHRQGTPGFSQDARRAFAHNMSHGARYLAKLHFADRLTDRVDEMQDYVRLHANDARYDAVKAQQVADEMVKRHDQYMNPNTHPLATALTSFGFVFYLGLSPASAAVNLSQTALVAYPILGGKYGFGKSGAALLRASKDAMSGHNDMGKVLTGDELAAYNHWVNIGLIDVSQAHDLAGIADGNEGKLWGKLRPVMKAASFMFHHAERFNRQATALAAYRLARGQGMSHDAAMEAAIEDTYAGHFDYSAGNRPRIMQGNVARVLLLFKQYAQNMIYTFANETAKALKGDKAARKTISGLLVTHALAAGVLGLPMVTTLLAAASMFGGDDDEPWDAQVALRNLFADTFGDKAGEVLAHGLSRLTPWDISGRVGLNHLILPDVQEGLEGQRWAESWMTGWLGPVAGAGVNMAKGMHTILAGDMQRGLEELAPAAARGPLRAWRYAMEGVQDKTGVEILPETTLAEDAGQLLGFSPGRAREAQEAKSAVYQADKALLERRQALMTAFARAQLAQEDTQAVLEQIQAFNALHPNRHIGAMHLQHSIKARLRRMAEAEQGIYLPKNRQDARAAGAFAAQDE